MLASVSFEIIKFDLFLIILFHLDNLDKIIVDLFYINVHEKKICQRDQNRNPAENPVHN